jgi:hypothetical protein
LRFCLYALAVLGILVAFGTAPSSLEIPWLFEFHNIAYALAMALGVLMVWRPSNGKRLPLGMMIVGMVAVGITFEIMTFAFLWLLQTPAARDIDLFSIQASAVIWAALHGLAVPLGASLAEPKLRRPAFLLSIVAIGAAIGAATLAPAVGQLAKDSDWPIASIYFPVADGIFGACLGIFLFRAAAIRQAQAAASISQSRSRIPVYGAEEVDLRR